MSWHSCKVISLFAESVERSRWALHPPSPPWGLVLTAVWDWQRQRNFTRERVWTAVPRRLLHSAVSPQLSPFQVRVEESLTRLWFSHHRKWKAPLPTAQQQINPWSLFLSTYTPTRAQTACTNSVWGISLGIGRALQELPPLHSSSSDHRHLTMEILLPPRFFLDLRLPWELQDTPPCTLLNPLCSLFVCQLLHLFCLYVLLPVSTNPLYSAVFSHQLLFCFFFSLSLPPCLLQLSKQTNPLPLDTQLRCGDLLCLSGRILSDIVAPVNKRKAPEARGAALFVRRADYLPHTPFCLFSLSGV